MRHSLITAAMSLAIMLAMVGIADAGCPANSKNFPTTDVANAYSTVNGTIASYFLDTTNNLSKVRDYCIYPTPGFEGSISDLTAIYPNFDVNRPDHSEYFGFGKDTGKDLIPLDGSQGIPIGKADYKQEDRIPEKEVIILHINDNTLDHSICGSDGNTCFRKTVPPTPIAPVPELPTVALMGLGIMSLLYIVRRKI